MAVQRNHARLAELITDSVADASGEFVAGEVLRTWSLAKAWVPGPPIGARIGHAAPGPHVPGRSNWVPHPGDEHYDGNLWGATGKVTATNHRERRESPGGEHWVTIRGHAVWIDQSVVVSREVCKKGWVATREAVSPGYIRSLEVHTVKGARNPTRLLTT